MMKRTILVTGAGGGGSNNLIRSLRASSLELEICGSNLSPFVLAKSNADKNFLLPAADDSRYVDALLSKVEEEGIELVLPNSDREIRRISVDRQRLTCRLFLPPKETVTLCHDKFLMHLRLEDANLKTAKSIAITSLDDVEAAIQQLSHTGDRFWIRPRTGSGSKGATWVKTADQARSWISLWTELRGFSVDEFTISEFLPGRDYAFQSTWNQGRLVVAKMCERISYFFGENLLSGMSSTPALARTVRDDDAIETALNAVRAICPEPHGNFNLDMKADRNGVMNVTECNIGRFFMITPIFDLTGKINTAEAYVRCAFGETLEYSERIDIEENMFLLRELDTEPLILSLQHIENLRFL